MKKMRRSIRALIYKNDKDRCYWCGKKLTDTEKYYYGNSCDKCEEKEMKILYKY